MTIDAAWAGLIGGLGGALLVSWGAYSRERVQFRREKSWRLYEERLARLEQLFEWIEEVRAGYADTAFKIAHGLSRGVAPTNLHTKSLPWPKLRMLVSLYAPELATPLAEYQALGDRLSHQFLDALDAIGKLGHAEQRAMALSLAAAKDTLNFSTDHLLGLVAQIAQHHRDQAQKATSTFFDRFRSDQVIIWGRK